MPCRIVALTVLLLITLITSAHADSFRTPNKAAYCYFTAKGEPAEGGPASNHQLWCWTPNDGFALNMNRPRGKAYKGYDDRFKGNYPSMDRVLRFGQRWSRPGYTCASRSTGLTCKNRAGHGWWLGRFKGYKLF